MNSKMPFWYWKVVTHRQGVELSQSSQVFFYHPGDPVRENLLALDFKPQLVQRGQIHRRVLALCDGHTTISAIVQALRVEFPEVFPSEEKAHAAVMRILGTLIAREK